MSSALSPKLSGEDPRDLDAWLKYEVREAVRSKIQAGYSNSTSPRYSSLLNQIRTVKEQALKGGDSHHIEQLIYLLDALSACVGSLHERNHESLIHEVLSISIWKSCQDVRTALLRLVIHMVVANSALVPVCLRMLVLAMQPPPTPPKEDAEAAVSLEAWRPAADVEEVQGEVIASLEKILKLVPTAPSRMVTIVAGGIPYKLRDRDAQCAYLHGALTLAQRPAAAAVRDGILAAAVNHLLGLDVEVRWQDIVAAEAEAEEEEGESEKEEEDIFALEGETEHLHLSSPGEALPAADQERIQGRGGWEGAARGADAAQASSSGRQATTETAEKLDALMVLTLEHLEHRCEQGQLAGAWSTLLHAFERSILDTHRSKFTQYLLWYLCKQGPQQCSSSFLQLLLHRLTKPNVAPITRSAAAAYLASFLARASFVPEPLLLQTLQRLAEWCLSYCQDQDSRVLRAQNAISTAHTSTKLDLDAGPAKGIQHQVFYAACQALLYILCYRLDHLMEARQPAHGCASNSPTGVLDTSLPGADVHKQLRGLFTDVMPQLLNHRLAPLSVCLPTVVAEFSRLAQRLGLMECGALLPQRAQAMRAQRPLEMFFPFDPYLLRRSAQFLELERTYVHWRQGHPQAAAQGGHEDASDVSSEEGVNAGSDSDDADKAASHEDDSASSADSSQSDSDASEEQPSRMDMGSRRLLTQRRRSTHFQSTPLSAQQRPVSAVGLPRKRAASCTPGSDQGYLHGTSVDTNSAGGVSSLHGMSPGASPSALHAPMSWTPAA